MRAIRNNGAMSKDEDGEQTDKSQLEFDAMLW